MSERVQKPSEEEGSALTPLYARLPRGPHQMARGEVAQNQRQRMHGAMVEAVATNGYARTSVKQVVSLAGVSRRAFYEQFANKQDCFLATIDLVAGRAAACIDQAYRSTEGGLAERMRAALGAFAELVHANPKGARLVLIDAPSAGQAGWLRQMRMLLTFEQMLAASFAHTDGAWPLPTPIVRGIAGGLHRLAFARVHDARTEELAELVDDMLSWMLAMQAPTAMDLLDGASAPAGVSDIDGARALVVGRSGTGSDRPDALASRPRNAEELSRMRLLDSALHMAALEGCESLSPLRIVDHAGVSIDVFFDLFTDMEDCFLQALRRLSGEVHRTLSDPGLGTEEWSLTVFRALRRLLHQLAAHPTRARMIAMGSFEVGSAGIGLNLELASEVAGRLIEGAPGKADSAIVQEAVAGAIWHTVYCHVASRKLEKLPGAASHLAYVVLAPFLGAEKAVEALTGKRGHTHQASATAPRNQRVGRLVESVSSTAAF